MRSFIYSMALVSSLLFISCATAADSIPISFETKNNSSTKAILVTGASSGIGEQIALTLSQNGYYVYAGARKDKDLVRLNKIPNMQSLRLDVTKQSDIDAAVRKIQAEGRGLFGLVNNAGVFLFDPLIEVSEQDMQFIIDVNVMGPYRVTKAFAPLIIESKGRINTIGSVAGLFSGRLFGPYGISKFAVEAYSEALASEMKKFDVEVSIIEPGNFRSNIMQNMQKRLAKIDQGERPTQYREEIERMANFTKTDRSHHASPKPVAEAALHFMSSDQPKFRYLVTPNKNEADYAIKKTLQRVVELNQEHPYSQSYDELSSVLKSLLTDMNE